MPMMAVLERITFAALDSTLETPECVALGDVEVAVTLALALPGPAVLVAVVAAAAPWPVAVKGRKVTGI